MNKNLSAILWSLVVLFALLSIIVFMDTKMPQRSSFKAGKLGSTTYFKMEGNNYSSGHGYWVRKREHNK